MTLRAVGETQSPGSEAGHAYPCQQRREVRPGIPLGIMPEL